MEKTFELKIKITAANTPQNWIFSKDVSGIEQLTIVRELAEKQIKTIILGS